MTYVDFTEKNILELVRPENLIGFMQLVGWQQTKQNEKWRVFTLDSQKDIHGSPAELVMPIDLTSSEMGYYLSNAIKVLSSLSNEPEDVLMMRIQYFDTDVLTVRNIETGNYTSIPLYLANAQIASLKSLMGYAASSEREPRPHFERLLSVAKSAIQHCRFGHTFRGSFGLKIESPVIHPAEILSKKNKEEGQEPLLESDDMPEGWRIIEPPFERKVIERIIRGLINTRQATQERQVEPLIEGYRNGLNANMCQAFIKLSGDSASPIEYGVLWSPRVEPSEDIANFSSVTLNETSYDYLYVAVEELRFRDPQFETIHGRVTELSSQDAPHSRSAASRSVVVWWTERPDNARPIRVVVPLGRENYLEAIKAHEDWSTVEVTGILSRAGQMLRLLNAHNFKVLNPK